MNEDFLAMLNGLSDQDRNRTEIVRAPFGWPGSKARSLDNILPELPYRNGFCDAFGGSGNVLWARNESPLEIYNDRYGGLTCFYRCVRDRQTCQKLLDRLEIAVHSREEFQWCKDTWEGVADDVERAARWYYMLTMSFGQKGRAFGRCIKGSGQMGKKYHNNLKLFWPLHARIKRVQVENQDWRQLFKDYDREDMVWYLDPPYYPGTTSSGIYIHTMTREEHHELLERIQYLQGFVALSGYSNPAYESRVKWTKVKKWMVDVTISGLAFTESNNLAGMEDEMRRGKAQECLYILEK